MKVLSALQRGEGQMNDCDEKKMKNKKSLHKIAWLLVKIPTSCAFQVMAV